MENLNTVEDGYSVSVPILNHNGVPVRPGNYWIDSELAERWLLRNLDSNRKKSSIRVGRYAKAMQEGRWKLTHQSIAFDRNDNLIDGQHRLLAVARSQTVVPLRVHVGADPATFAVIDTGYGRVASQFMRVSNANIIRSAARIILFAQACQANGGEVILIQRNDVENDVIFETVDAWPELQQYAGVAGRIYRACGSPASNMLAVLAQAARGKAPELIDPFTEKMVSGEDLSKGDPVLLLRNRGVARLDRSLAARDKAILYGTTVKAWNAHAKGERMSFLRFIYDDKTEEGMLPVSGARGSTGMKEKLPPVH
ncbi:hypothetical protein ACIRPT_13045 [Streptomyces sp. NPDC101227]|uniref:hypothetical protein n=1 Tax=Streptomyces sp. NPDC101227 TaxID=3366136 RepID=UPI00381A7378